MRDRWTDRQTETERNIKAERQRDLKFKSRKLEINKQKTEQQRSIKLKVESQQRKKSIKQKCWLIKKASKTDKCLVRLTKILKYVTYSFQIWNNHLQTIKRTLPTILNTRIWQFRWNISELISKIIRQLISFASQFMNKDRQQSHLWSNWKHDAPSEEPTDKLRKIIHSIALLCETVSRETWTDIYQPR